MTRCQVCIENINRCPRCSNYQFNNMVTTNPNTKPYYFFRILTKLSKYFQL